MIRKLVMATAALGLSCGCPVLADDAAVARGADVFDDCSVCHGDDGEGGEDFGAPKLAGQLDFYLVRQLKNFRAGIRGMQDGDEFGPVMQPMAAELEDQEIEDVVAYIMTLDASVEPDAD